MAGSVDAAAVMNGRNNQAGVPAHAGAASGRAEAELPVPGDRASALRVEQRDKELLAHVAVAKYLNVSQILRLVFRAPLRQRT